MKTEILTKLERLLETDNIFTVQQEFKQLAAQFRNLIDHGISDTEGDDEQTDDEHDEDHSADTKSSREADTKEVAPWIENSADSASSPKIEAVSDSDDVKQTLQIKDKITDENTGKEESSVSENAEETLTTDSSAVESFTASESDEPTVIEESESTDIEPKSGQVEKDTAVETGNFSNKTVTDSQTKGNESESFDEAKAHFEAIVNKFTVRLEKARNEKKKLEEDTISTAKDLLEELQKLVENEENIGKAFNGFNAIQDKWKSLPRVSNDAYRDLNVEYNKFAEQFFYNINIYKELKELDLKHNLEQKLIVIEDQKKLSELNDIRRMEVEVRLNQDRWNEIGPTFKEEWNKIKDEFWSVTKVIYKKIQDFYNDRREQQQKNFEQKEELLKKLNQILAMNLKSNKKWQSKTSEVIDLQKQWKMIGFVPKEKGNIWKEFRKGCDMFFESKRLFLKEITDIQDANREAKQKLLDIAESIKDSEDFKETSHQLINLQKQWKEIGSANQRDENKLWRKFRQACDTFFQKRKGQKEEEITEQKANLVAKKELLKELDSFEPGSDPGENVKNLKSFAEKWRAIGHVPFKEKDHVNKAYKKLLDSKFGALKIDRKQKEKIRFEQKLEDIRDRDDNDYLIRKEQDAIRAKISKLKTEIIQFENNMGFFASSKEANKLKEEVALKVNKLEDEITTLKGRLALLREA